ncbi:hypothetical protein Tco_1447857 [Tanacetum coccineum]
MQESFEYHRPIFMVPFRYLKIRLTACKGGGCGWHCCVDNMGDERLLRMGRVRRRAGWAWWELGSTSRNYFYNFTAKLHILNPGDYELWLMRIEQYFPMTNYFLWKVIKNGNKVLKRTVGETEQEYKPTTAEAKPGLEECDEKLEETLLQKLISQLEIQGEVITQEDMNLKLLRSLHLSGRNSCSDLEE